MSKTRRASFPTTKISRGLFAKVETITVPSLDLRRSFEMLVDGCSQIMSSQNPSNSNGNSGGPSFAEPYGNRVLSLTEVDSLRRMTMQNSQQQLQHNNGGLQQQSQLPTNPFLVLTQVPVQATPFANFANAQGNNQSCMTQAHNNHNGNGGQQQQSSGDFMPEDDSWAQMLQPTPLAPNHYHNSGGMPQQQQQPQQQRHQQLQHGMSHVQPVAPQSQSSDNGNSNNSTSFNPSTMTFLQELMMNAATAALQQQQQMMQQQNNGGSNPMDSSNGSGGNAPNNSFGNMSQQQLMQGMNQALTGRMPVDSSVSPVPRPDNNNNNNSSGSEGVQAWKQMWDSASKTMFQQQHQLLHQAATGQDNKHFAMINTANFPAQPSKRKFTDFQHSDVSTYKTVKREFAIIPETSLLPLVFFSLSISVEQRRCCAKLSSDRSS